MALWEFRNLNKHGNFRKRIIYTDGALSIPGGAFGPSVMANRFKYEYREPVMPPSILEINGKTYLMPLWKEVVKGTTIEDVEWIKPKKKRTEPIVEMHVSSSKPDISYKTTYYPDSGNFYCNCPGRWRAFDGKCKHIKALEAKINK
tara:strand:+ start:16528 stop:16965 length:438 start_codon:yes stop_codon:yes gene_type:complete